MPVSSTEEIVVLGMSVPMKPLSLLMEVIEVWPQSISPSEGGVASMSVSPSKGGVVYITATYILYNWVFEG